MHRLPSRNLAIRKGLLYDQSRILKPKSNIYISQIYMLDRLNLNARFVPYIFSVPHDMDLQRLVRKTEQLKTFATKTRRQIGAQEDHMVMLRNINEELKTQSAFLRKNIEGLKNLVEKQQTLNLHRRQCEIFVSLVETLPQRNKIENKIDLINKENVALQVKKITESYISLYLPLTISPYIYLFQFQKLNSDLQYILSTRKMHVTMLMKIAQQMETDPDSQPIAVATTNAENNTDSVLEPLSSSSNNLTDSSSANASKAWVSFSDENEKNDSEVAPEDKKVEDSAVWIKMNESMDTSQDYDESTHGIANGPAKVKNPENKTSPENCAVSGSNEEGMIAEAMQKAFQEKPLQEDTVQVNVMDFIGYVSTDSNNDSKMQIHADDTVCSENDESRKVAQKTRNLDSFTENVDVAVTSNVKKLKKKKELNRRKYGRTESEKNSPDSQDSNNEDDSDNDDNNNCGEKEKCRKRDNVRNF